MRRAACEATYATSGKKRSFRSHRQREPAIGGQRRAGDVAGLVRAQEDDCLGYLLRPAGAPGVNTLRQEFVVDLVAENRAPSMMHRRIDKSRAHQVHADSLPRQFRGNTGSEPDQAVFRRLSKRPELILIRRTFPPPFEN